MRPGALIAPFCVWQALQSPDCWAVAMMRSRPMYVTLARYGSETLPVYEKLPTLFGVRLITCPDADVICTWIPWLPERFRGKE